MKIAIIGAGLTGLSTAYHLSKLNHQITIFEKNHYLGGLAGNFKENDWQWHLEKYYHHFFNNDQSVEKLIGELKTENKLFFKKPVTSIYYKNEINHFDTPFSLVSFPHLSLIDKIKTALTLVYLKFTPFNPCLEKKTAFDFLTKLMGKKSFEILWQPLFVSKFGNWAKLISASWFWARIKKRTTSLGYYQGGLQELIDDLVKNLNQNNVKIVFNTKIINIKQAGNQFLVNSNKYDALIITAPTPTFLRIVPFLPDDYRQQLASITHFSALSLILVTDKPILKDTYWLNINDNTIPFVSLVQHTNFIDKKYYGGKHIAYIGNYLPQNHLYLQKTKEELLSIFLPFIKKISPSSNFQLLASYLFKDDYAQTMVTTNYQKLKPTIETPIKNLYLGNIDVVYPWDRGINYAIELGQQIANTINNKN